MTKPRQLAPTVGLSHDGFRFLEGRFEGLEGYAVGVVLGQRVDKKLNVIQYARKTLDNAQRNYATTEKEFLAVVSWF